MGPVLDPNSWNAMSRSVPHLGWRVRSASSWLSFGRAFGTVAGIDLHTVSSCGAIASGLLGVAVAAAALELRCKFAGGESERNSEHRTVGASSLRVGCYGGCCAVAAPFVAGEPERAVANAVVVAEPGTIEETEAS